MIKLQPHKIFDPLLKNLRQKVIFHNSLKIGNKT